MSNDPRQLSYWTNEERAQWDALAPLIMQIYLAGADSGVSALPSELQILVNWDYFNNDVAKFLNTYRLHTLAGITNTTRTQTVTAIEKWLESGEHLDTLIERLTPIYGARRAEQIAVTEVTRIYAEGNMSAWRSTGLVSGKRWNTAEDERVCPICGPLDGMIVGLDENGFTTELSALDAREVILEMRQLEDGRYIWNGHLITPVERFGTTMFQIGITAPPAHPRCRCWLTPVVGEDLLRDQLRRILA